MTAVRDGRDPSDRPIGFRRRHRSRELSTTDIQLVVLAQPRNTDEGLTLNWKGRFGESVGPVETLGVYFEVGDWGGVFH